MKEWRSKPGLRDRILVAHGGGSKFTLLLFSNIMKQVETINVPRAALAEVSEGTLLGGASRVFEKFSRILAVDGRGQLIQAAGEMARGGSYQVVVAPPFREADTSVMTKPVGILDNADVAVSTIGLTLQSADGDWLISTAAHALDDNQTDVITSTGKRFRARTVDRLITDSAILLGGESPTTSESFVGHNGPKLSEDVNGAFGLYIPAVFSGYASGASVETVVQGIDFCVFDMHPDDIVRVYTRPDTAPGDSGAALVDPSDDRVIGFARRRGGLTVPPAVRTSTWSWAEQVYLKHSLPY